PACPAGRGTIHRAADRPRRPRAAPPGRSPWWDSVPVPGGDARRGRRARLPAPTPPRSSRDAIGRLSSPGPGTEPDGLGLSDVDAGDRRGEPHDSMTRAPVPRTASLLIASLLIGGGAVVFLGGRITQTGAAPRTTPTGTPLPSGATSATIAPTTTASPTPELTSTPIPTLVAAPLTGRMV